MFTIDRQRFFADWPARVRLPLTDARRAAVEFLLDASERDSALTMIREFAYVLATIRWETGQTFEPVRERRASETRNPRLFALQQRYWPSGFFGRGYVQMTWEKNYRLAGARLAGETFQVREGPVVFSATTLVENPDFLLERAVSYRIAVRGMREGWFTGKRLSQYITDGAPPDYVNARRIINGTDRAAEIAAMANEFELLLRASATALPAAIVVVAEVTPSEVAEAIPAATGDGEGRPVTRSLRRIRSMLGDGASRVRDATRRLATRRGGKSAAPAGKRGRVRRKSAPKRGEPDTPATAAPRRSESGATPARRESATPRRGVAGKGRASSKSASKRATNGAAPTKGTTARGTPRRGVSGKSGRKPTSSRRPSRRGSAGSR